MNDQDLAGGWISMPPRARPLVWAGYAGRLLLLVVVAVVPLLVARAWAAAAVVGVVTVVVVVAAAGRLADARMRRAGFERSDWTLVARDGAVVHHERHVPVARVQHVDLREGVLDRRLRLAGLTVHTAAPSADVVLEHLDVEVARAARAELLSASRAATSDLVGELRDGA